MKGRGFTLCPFAACPILSRRETAEYSAADIAVEERPFQGRVHESEKENNSALPINHAQPVK